MCKIENLESSTVGEHMSRDVIKLSPRDSIASPCTTLRSQKIRGLPLVCATDRLAGVISFRDIAA